MKHLLICCIILHIFILTLSQIQNRILRLRNLEVCYDTVGCFNIARHHSPLQKLPENPLILETKFYLFRRNINMFNPEILTYNELQSIKNSKYNVTQPLKIIIHGYMTTYNETGAILGMQAYLNISSCNVILVDWERGARGPSYSSAAANTELVGRQLGLLLLQLLWLGAAPKHIHIIGFSLGAHVAACASEILKQHGFLIGRITGLDPASPLFKLNHFRDKRKKLDISDAEFVDVVHTDGSPVFTDGFGLLEPLGHVDFFPNGGRQQPGCNDIKNSVVRSHFDKNLDREVACSHIRAYHYFLETLLNESTCKFKAYSCPWGPRDFAFGRCFPQNTYDNINGQLGENAFGKGVLYLTTRNEPPFCGMQMQLIISISRRTRRMKGVIFAHMEFHNSTADFTIFSDLNDLQASNRQLFGLGAGHYEILSQNIPKVSIDILFQRFNAIENQNKIKQVIFVDKIQIKTMNRQSWQICSEITLHQNTMLNVELTTDIC